MCAFESVIVVIERKTYFVNQISNSIDIYREICVSLTVPSSQWQV